jgi:ribosomal 50S subunit-recycling heat shock protein
LPKRRPVYSSGEVSVGDIVEVKLYEGELNCKVMQLKD